MRSFPAATVADAPYAAPRWRTRALAATALAALPAPFVLGGLALNESRQLHAAQLLETRLMFARAVMSQVAMAVSWGQAAMRAVALQPGPRVALEGGEASEAAVVIDGLMRSTLLHAAVAIVAADGRVVAVAPHGSAPMFAGWWAGAFVRLPDGTPALAVAAPVRDADGRTLGEVRGLLSFARVAEALAARGFGRTGAVTLLARDGDVLSSTDAHRRGRRLNAPWVLDALASGRDATSSSFFAPTTGRAEIGALAQSQAQPVAVLVSQSLDEATAPSRGLVRAWATGLALALLGCAAIVALGLRALRRHDASLRSREQRYRMLFEGSLGLICEHDLDGRLRAVNPAAASTLGYEPAELEGRTLIELVPAAHRPLVARYLARIVAHGADEGLVTLLRRDGSACTWRYRNRLFREPNRAAFVVGHAQDVTSELRHQQRLRAETMTDALTGVHNRRFLEQFEGDERPGERWGCVVVDIDHFKAINDTQGHARGDAVLVAVAHWLRDQARREDAVVRTGGDEFLVLLEGAAAATAPALAARIRDGAPGNLPCSLSVGAAVRHAAEPFAATFARADAALYAERARVRGTAAAPR